MSQLCFIFSLFKTAATTQTQEDPFGFFFQQNGFFIVKSFTSVGSLSESNQKPEEEGKHSFAVSYLINSCGLSTKSAILPISD